MNLSVIEDDLSLVETSFQEYLASRVPLIAKIGKHILSSGGKRIRPAILLLSSRLNGYRGQRAIRMASIVEFIHTATLLHDDVVDNADIRRGTPAANTLWGSEASVLVGDFLFSKSFSERMGFTKLSVFSFLILLIKTLKGFLTLILYLLLFLKI